LPPAAFAAAWSIVMANEKQRAAEQGPAHQAVEVGVALLTLAFGVLIMAGSIKAGMDWGVEGPKPGFFPFYISLFIIVGSLVNIVQVATGADGKPGVFSNWEQLWRVMSVVLPTTAYVALVPFIGIYVASALLIAVFMIWLGRYSVWMTAPIALGIPLIAYVVFERYFQIALPKGPIENMLGI
jgi:putative tricarboxylic transport membrane protein